MWRHTVAECVDEVPLPPVAVIDRLVAPSPYERAILQHRLAVLRAELAGFDVSSGESSGSDARDGSSSTDANDSTGNREEGCTQPLGLDERRCVLALSKARQCAAHCWFSLGSDSPAGLSPGTFSGFQRFDDSCSDSEKSSFCTMSSDTFGENNVLSEGRSKRTRVDPPFEAESTTESGTGEVGASNPLVSSTVSSDAFEPFEGNPFKVWVRVRTKALQVRRLGQLRHGRSLVSLAKLFAAAQRPFDAVEKICECLESLTSYTDGGEGNEFAHRETAVGQKLSSAEVVELEALGLLGRTLARHPSLAWRIGSPTDCSVVTDDRKLALEKKQTWWRCAEARAVRLAALETRHAATSASAATAAVAIGAAAMLGVALRPRDASTRYTNDDESNPLESAEVDDHEGPLNTLAVQAIPLPAHDAAAMSDVSATVAAVAAAAEENPEGPEPSTKELANGQRAAAREGWKRAVAEEQVAILDSVGPLEGAHEGMGTSASWCGAKLGALVDYVKALGPVRGL